MKTRIIVSLLITIAVISLSGCFGNDKVTYAPTNYPDSVWKAEEVDMFFKVTEFSYGENHYFTLGKLKDKEKEYTVSLCFGIGRNFSVELIDIEVANTFTDDSKCVLAKGNCTFKENLLIVKLEKIEIFNDIKKITFIKQNTSDPQSDTEFNNENFNVCFEEGKSNWQCDNFSASFSVNRNNDICYQGNISFKGRTIRTAVVFGLQSKIYFLDLDEYKTTADKFDATIIEGNYEYKDDALIVHIETSTVLGETPDTLIFKKTEIRKDNRSENSKSIV